MGFLLVGIDSRVRAKLVCGIDVFATKV